MKNDMYLVRPQVFISYKSEDRAFVSELEQRIALYDLGVTTWTDDVISAGENWKQKIDEAIKASFLFIVVMTPKAKNSEYVTYEWSFAMGLGTSKILPILLEKTELHPKLEELEYLDFTVRYGEEWDKLESILRVSKEQFDIFSKVPHAIQMATFSLKSWNPFERCAAIKVFGEQKYVVAWETIVDFLDDPSWEVREETVETLKIFADKRTVSHLADAARKDEDWRVRSHAIEALVQIDAESVVPTLVDALKDENNHIRNDAIEALIKIDIETAIPHIRSLLKDSNQRVKRGAIDALRNLGTPEALAALAELGL